MEGALKPGGRAVPRWRRWGWLGAMLLAPAVAAIELPPFAENLATPQHLNSLRHGGYVLYMRHGHTDNAQQDRFPAPDPADCSTQRPLSDFGRRTLAEVGTALRQARLPLGEVHASPLCRTRESAELAFGRGYRIAPELLHLPHMSAAEKEVAAASIRRLLSTPVPAGRNRVLVAHAFNLTDLIGYYPQEATLVIFRPQGNGSFSYVASIPPTHWESLLR